MAKTIVYESALPQQRETHYQRVLYSVADKLREGLCSAHEYEVVQKWNQGHSLDAVVTGVRYHLEEFSESLNYETSDAFKQGYMMAKPTSKKKRKNGGSARDGGGGPCGQAQRSEKKRAHEGWKPRK
ncbi:hypothetical protein JXC34_02470 [Candidatus Woesearchaeota archaeon]|nr:hypothetical protein [Candidatus Woesearchaeota archaeon]